MRTLQNDPKYHAKIFFNWKNNTLSDIKSNHTALFPSNFKADNHFSYLFAYLNVLRVFSQDAIPGEIVAIYGGKNAKVNKML